MEQTVLGFRLLLQQWQRSRGSSSCLCWWRECARGFKVLCVRVCLQRVQANANARERECSPARACTIKLSHIVIADWVFVCAYTYAVVECDCVRSSNANGFHLLRNRLRCVQCSVVCRPEHTLREHTILINVKKCKVMFNFLRARYT